MCVSGTAPERKEMKTTPHRIECDCSEHYAVHRIMLIMRRSQLCGALASNSVDPACDHPSAMHIYPFKVDTLTAPGLSVTCG